tara:strand:- start:502 stop:1536 length:1035 start_codon:yes stop_codon:yes gene_type:complete
MQVKYLSPEEDCSVWNAYVLAHPKGTAAHMAAWGRAVYKSMGHPLYFMYVEQGGRIRGLLPLVHVKSRLFGNALLSMAFSTYGGPLADDDEVLALLDEECARLSVKLKVDYVELRNMDQAHADWPCKDSLYSTFRKELSPDNEDNMKAIPRKQRAMVRKGIKARLRAEIDETVDRLYALYAESVRNLGTPVFPKSLFWQMKEQFGKDCEILTVCTEDGQALSSVMSIYFRDEVFPYYGGGTVAARHYAANDFMYWSVMARAVAERQCRIFDFGRSKNGTGAFNFKKYWGFEPRPLQYEYYLREGQQIPDINPLNPKYQLMIRTWRKLPLPVANLLGPMISRSLG